MQLIKTYDGFEIIHQNANEKETFQVGIDTPDGFFRFKDSYNSIEEAEQAIKQSSFTKV